MSPWVAAGDPAGRDLLPDHQAADGQPEPAERGARLGAHVARHRLLRAVHQPAQGGDALPALQAQPGLRRLSQQAPEDAEVCVRVCACVL